MPVSAKKQAYNAKVAEILAKYDQGFLVFADNVGSNQFAKIRIALRKLDGVVLMGKNTLMKKCIQNYIDESGDKKWEGIIPLMVGNVGLVFSTAELTEVRDLIKGFVVPAAARVGAIAPISVTIPAGNTGMDPSQTSFFQALNITTKITKGTVEIVSDVVVVRPGDKVGGSQAVLLQKLGIKPFEYGLEVRMVIQSGNVFDAKVLDMTDEDMERSFMTGLSNVTALSIGANYPVISAVPVHIVHSYKNVLAVVCALEGDDAYSFPQADKIKALLATL